MNAFRDPVVDADLDAYVDDQLDAARRIEVEAYLSPAPTRRRASWPTSGCATS